MSNTDQVDPEAVRQRELAHERAYVATLYERVDELRERAERRLRRALGADRGTRQALLDRDAFVVQHSDRLAQLAAAERGLCFGRLDHDDASRLYIGRLGLLDEERDPLLVDWRAPAAQPFYRATPANRGNVTRRRHLQTEGRLVTGYTDDVLDLAGISDEDRSTLTGEAALLASLSAGRTGRMHDIIATIQAEQDRIIRGDLAGILVVQGGPGTGKTVVALHRAAYLLYTHRERLGRRGVLVVGPNPTFLSYIQQVLPSLGETDVLLTTVAGLFPGVTPTGSESQEAAAIKGDPRMAEVLAAAVRDRQRVPSEPVELRIDDHVLVLMPDQLRRARTSARRSRSPHNEARRVFAREVTTMLTDQLATQMGERLDQRDLRELRGELRNHPAVQSLLDRHWPHLTPQRLLIELFASPRRLAAAARHLDRERVSLLVRRGEPRVQADGSVPVREGRAGPPEWTAADIPLLDEAAVLLGGDDDHDDEDRRARRRSELDYARDVLDSFGGDGMVDAETLAERYGVGRAHQTVAEKAAGDRSWIFGHVIVDEAQELSGMAWRMLMRRAPGRSMTVVGDLAQTSTDAGASSWAEVLDPGAEGRWRLEQLTVNYRTPAEIMAVAADVLAAIAPGLAPPGSVREAGAEPWSHLVPADRLHEELPKLVAEEAAAGGKLAVIVPAARAEELGALLVAEVPGVVAGQRPEALDAPVAVLTVAESKGLEFDAVVVVEPGAILAASPHGGNDLYVALSRATQRLGVVHTEPLPEMLSKLRAR